ncbi:TPA: UDP-N-acetylglucosamine 2-epimerase (non-hydrolyzing), partial [Candidatus Bathyarchaeota archaeon]|nr:UDP-N-acetylglucosamine 2-epimerase (non-hydrolyzing) [Candidatus Bathyarchaeota archaeon]
TRPEIIKISPIIRAFERKDVPFVFVHSGQHYDYNLSLQFIEELGLPKPDFDLKVRERSPGRQTGRILIGFEKAIKKFKPSILLVEGDTNSVLAAALAANKNNVALGHVEAGLRSFDLRMPEEHNRRLVDHISNYLFAPTSVAKENLIRENVWGAIYVTGNTVIDACIENLPLAEKKSNIMSIIDVKEYILATIHRSENVDNPEVLRNFIEAFEESPLPVVVPLHPRTVNRLKRLKLWTKIKKSCNVKVLPPVGYFDFLILMKNSRLIMTDSGGIQEEATAPPIRKFVLILRTSTERPEAIKAGFARITGVSKDRILLILKEALERKVLLPETSPFGDGMSGERITDIILGKILPRLK